MLPRAKRSATLADIEPAYSALRDKDITYFSNRLSRPEYWRLAAAFPGQVLFLDIETTGLSRIYHQLTLIGWSRQQTFGVVSANDGLPGVSELKHELSLNPILVTYNGSHFDIPFLRNALPDLSLPNIHIDLRHLGQRVGLVGGQKKIELELGISRSRRISGIGGELAPALWFRYQRGDLDALVELIEYNHADVEGLKLLLREMIRRQDPLVDATWDRSNFNSWLQTERHAKSHILETFRGESRPRLQLNKLSLPSDFAVVGIDLSGGPKRPTGWALLTGPEVRTAALRTDSEILAHTVAAKPNLVSIDAPLSLPEGRTSVEDSDPGRLEYGITRHAERLLRSRGVNTYPALIQSMQSLTARGIRLAETLRSKGIPVIESFPGAMQDILGMPRKGLSLPALKLSLHDYGLTDNFLQREMIHDEIDAISSAIVGQTFWSGYFEPLGNEAEGYLIVPSMTPRPPQIVITLSGPIAAGKTTLAAFLEELGFTRVRYSEILAEDAGSHIRTKLSASGSAIHASGEQRKLNERVYSRVGTSRLAVVDGVRYPEDIAYATERAGAHHIAVFIDAANGIRAKRWNSRKLEHQSLASADAGTSEQYLDFIRERVEIVYDNSGSMYDLKIFASQLAQRSTLKCLSQLS